MTSRAIFAFATAAAILGLGTGTQASAGQSPVVVELFTSQGCSSCPPANANLVKLSDDPGVLALSFSVTYWDYLGWKDIFGKPEFTDRQAIYEPALGQPGPFTPQMVINGHRSTVGYDLGEIRSQIASERTLAKPSVEIGAEVASIGPGLERSEPADVWLVRYQEGTVDVPVARGENAGETLPHAHVVRALKHLGTWSGKTMSLRIQPSTDHFKRAVLIQEPRGGRVLAAATD